MTDRPVRVGFVSWADPRDIGAWSGTLHSMLLALEQEGLEVVVLPHTATLGPLERARRAVRRAVGGRRYKAGHSLLLSRAFGRSLDRALGGAPVDVLFACAAATQVAHVQAPVPIVYSSDATFSLLLDEYPGFSGLSRRSQREGDALERMAVTRAVALVYPSQWAAASAVADYGARAERVHVVPYGANRVPPAATTSTRGAPHTPARLLFVAAEWERKGGAIAVAARDALDERGIDATLTVCGCHPPGGASRGVEVLGRLDPGVAAERERLERLFADADVLVLPTRADCSPIVLTEALAHGLPVVTSAAGGVPEIIDDGVTGAVLPLDVGGEAFAEAIAGLLEPSRYSECAMAARRASEQRFSWGLWAREVGAILRRAAQR